MVNPTEKQQAIKIGGIALAACALALVGVWYAKSCVAEVLTQLEDKENEVRLAESRIKLIPATEDEVIVLRENLENYVKILPDSKELVAFVRMIDEFERQSGMLGTGLVPVKAAESREVQRFKPIAYTYDARGSLWQFLKFLSLIESYDRFVAITDFSISADEQETRNTAPAAEHAVHQMRVTLRTFTYNNKGQGKEVVIANYDKRKHELSEEIWKRIRDIRIAKYEYREKPGRRDIFVDPRMVGEAGVGESMEVQKQLLERYSGEAARLLTLVKKLRDPSTHLFEQLSLEKGLREGLSALQLSLETDNRLVTFAPFRLKWATQVTAPLDEISSHMQAGVASKPQDPFLSKAEMQAVVQAMTQDLDAGKLEDAKGRYDAVAARMRVPDQDERRELAVQATALCFKAKTALDFQGLALRVSGVVVDHGGHSGVLVNGQVYEEGEFIADDLLLKRVEEERIWFVYRGLTLVRTM